MKTTKERRKERKGERFRRQFHSRERVRFFKALPCEVAGGSHLWRVENAHTESDGIARRGPYESIVPLFDTVHHDFDEMPEAKFEAKYGRTKQSVRDRAAHYHQMWEERREQ